MSPRRYASKNWPLVGLECAGVVFLAGLLSLNFNPFLSWYGADRLDWRSVWWLSISQTLTGAGLLLSPLALLACLAGLVSRCVHGRWWPYVAAAVAVVAVVLWVSPTGFTRTLTAHFEWNATDGFQIFRLQQKDGAAQDVSNKAWTWMVAAQIEPLLQDYFRANNWQKMNGDEDVVVTRILPIAHPVALGSGETLQDPDETPLMEAANRGDVTAAQKLLAGGAEVNARDQGEQTALIYACRSANANPALVKVLLAAGADVNVRSRTGYTALLWAQTRNNAEIVRLLRRANARP